MKTGGVGENKRLRQAQGVHRKMDAHGLAELRYLPPQLDSGGGAPDAVRALQQRGPLRPQPIREQPPGTGVEEGCKLRAACDRHAVFGIDGADQVCAGGLRLKGVASTGTVRGHSGIGRKLAGAEPAHVIVSGKDSVVEREVSSKTCRSSEDAADGPGIALTAERIGQQAGVIGRGTYLIFRSTQPASGHGGLRLETLVRGLMRPMPAERMVCRAGSKRGVDDSRDVGRQGQIILRGYLRHAICETERVAAGNGNRRGQRESLASRSEQVAVPACVRKIWPHDVLKYAEAQRNPRAEHRFLCHADQYLQTVWTAFEVAGEEFLAAQQIEDVVNNSRRAAQAGMAADERDLLAAEFLDANGNVGGVARLGEPDPKIFPL